jgi:uncharacterized protein (DUF486 family)
MIDWLISIRLYLFIYLFIQNIFTTFAFYYDADVRMKSRIIALFRTSNTKL